MTVLRKQGMVTPMMEAAGEASVLRKVGFHWESEMHTSPFSLFVVTCLFPYSNF